MIKRNAIKCLRCDTVIESKSIHDCQRCACASCFIDGGLERPRYGGYLPDIEVLIEFDDPHENLSDYDVIRENWATGKVLDELSELGQEIQSEFYLKGANREKTE